MYAQQLVHFTLVNAHKEVLKADRDKNFLVSNTSPRD